MVNRFYPNALLALSTACLVASLVSLAPGSAAQKNSTAAAGVSKLAVTFDGAHLAKTLNIKIVPKTPNSIDDAPFMNGEPEHLQISFDNDKINDGFDWHRQILVYPLTPYSQLFTGKERTEFDKTVGSLKSIVQKRSAAGVKELPMLPAMESYEVFHSHVKILDYKGGTGVAFITCYAQDEAPFKNGDFFYSYQGLSSDGKYYISLTYPVKAKALKDNTPLKAGIKLLTNLPDKEFTPSLSEIDKMIESISIK
ncbi:MAG: hypothetical protein P4L53_00835 [Candidatus Obscuribacterales bacterium]|nr:hypothetical protein [Candidatus Obscuribacterales bacterium]